MAKKSKDNKNLIIGICAAVAVVVVIVVAVVLIARGSGINDDYFVSDDTKYVLTMETDDSERSEVSPLVTHMVYTYKDDEITGMKTYAVYEDAEAAKKAFDTLSQSEEDMTNVVVEGKYIIKTNSEEDYKSMKASDIKSYINLLESLKNLENSDSTNTEESTETETTEETKD